MTTVKLQGANTASIVTHTVTNTVAAAGTVTFNAAHTYANTVTFNVGLTLPPYIPLVFTSVMAPDPPKPTHLVWQVEPPKIRTLLIIHPKGEYLRRVAMPWTAYGVIRPRGMPKLAIVTFEEKPALDSAPFHHPMTVFNRDHVDGYSHVGAYGLACFGPEAASRIADGQDPIEVFWNSSWSQVPWQRVPGWRLDPDDLDPLRLEMRPMMDWPVASGVKTKSLEEIGRLCLTQVCGPGAGDVGILTMSMGVV